MPYRYILSKFHRQVPAPGPNFSVAGHRTCQDRAWRRPCDAYGVSIRLDPTRPPQRDATLTTVQNPNIRELLQREQPQILAGIGVG